MFTETRDIKLTTIHANKQLVSILFVSFISFMGIALPYPILAPLFLSDTHVLGIGNYNIEPSILFGLTLSVYPLGQFFGSPILGNISDQKGRKPILIFSLFFSAIGYLFSAYALFKSNLEILIFSRFFTGFWEGNITIARAAATDISGVIPKTNSFGYINGAISLGYIIGPLLGGFLADDKIHPSFNHQLPFFAAAFLSIIGVILLIFFFSETNKNLNTETPKQNLAKVLFSCFSLMHRKIIAHLILLSFLITISFDIYYQFYPLYVVKKWQFTEYQIAIATGLLSIGMFSSQVCFTRILKKYIKIETGIITFSIAFIFVLLTMLFIKSITSLYVLFIVIGVFIGIVGTFLPVYISDHSPDNEQGKIMGLLMALRFIGDAAICVIGGIIAAYSMYAPFICGAICIFCGITWFIVLLRRF